MTISSSCLISAWNSNFCGVTGDWVIASGFEKGQFYLVRRKIKLSARQKCRSLALAKTLCNKAMLQLAGAAGVAHSTTVPLNLFTSNRLKGSLQGWKNGQGYRWHQFKTRHGHWTVTSTKMGGGFVANGSWRAVTHFARYFLGSPPDLVIKRAWHGRITLKTLRQQAARYGMVVSVDAAFPPALRSIAVSWPWMVALEADLSGGLEACRRGLNGFALADMRRIRREGYVMKVQPAGPAFDEFYHRYHFPSMRNRHGGDAYFCDLKREGIELGPNDVFVEVHGAEGCLAKVLVRKDEKGVRMSRLGWLDGRDDIYRKSVHGALYWHTISYEIEAGEVALNLGWVPPYLEDGLFTYKEKWLGRLSWQKSVHYNWRVVADPLHPTTQQFFDRTSLLVKSDATRRFDVISNRVREEVDSAQVENERLGEWLAPHQVWR